jgi:hypothetical protein
MSYATSDHWNRVFAERKEAGNDLDWGTQWTKVHIPVLRSANVQTVLGMARTSKLKTLVLGAGRSVMVKPFLPNLLVSCNQN